MGIKLPQYELKLTIGDVTIAVVAKKLPTGFDSFNVSAEHREFVSSAQPDAVYTVHYEGIPEIEFGVEIFKSGGVWSLHQNNGKFIVPLCSPPLGPQPYKLAVLEQDFTSGDIYIKPNILNGDFLEYPLAYPLDELLMVNLLCLGRGIEVHACGVVVKGEGLVFAGISGAGKSTLANLWKARRDVTILSDDRVIIRKVKGDFWVYGTPWHGDAQTSSPAKAPLTRIYFIRHASTNRQQALRRSDTVSRLLVRCFPTFWNASGMAYILQLCHELSMKIPCYELGFLPDSSAIDFIGGES
jgi:hypothetical protein